MSKVDAIFICSCKYMSNHGDMIYTCHRRVPHLITKITLKKHSTDSHVMICQLKYLGPQKTIYCFPALNLTRHFSNWSKYFNNWIFQIIFRVSFTSFSLLWDNLRVQCNASPYVLVIFSLIKSGLGVEACSISCFIYAKDVSAPLVFSSGFLIFFH